MNRDFLTDAINALPESEVEVRELFERFTKLTWEMAHLSAKFMLPIRIGNIGRLVNYAALLCLLGNFLAGYAFSLVWQIGAVCAVVSLGMVVQGAVMASRLEKRAAKILAEMTQIEARLKEMATP